MEMLRLSNRLEVSVVAASLDISEATVRRLFAQLEEQGKAIRVIGGVQLAPPYAYDYSYRVAAQHRSREKEAIGRRAAELVEENDRLFLDSGTTVLKLAEALSLRLQSGDLSDLIVLTNSLFLIDALARHCKVILIGGEIRHERRDVCGTVAEKSLAMFHVTKAFLGADAVHVRRGFMTTDDRTAMMSELVVNRADAVYVLADSGKFRATSFMTYGPLTTARCIITDRGLPEKVRAEFVKAGARVEVVPAAPE